MPSTTLPSLLLFGPQTSLPSQEQLTRLRTLLFADPLLAGFRTAIEELPQFWQTLVDFDRALEAVPGLEAANSLRRWLDGGKLGVEEDVPPNVLSTPFTVIIHVIQYFQYLAENKDRVTHRSLLDGIKKDGGSVEGFCTGFLTAAAVACSSTEEDVVLFSTVALRLSICIASYVDLEGRFAKPPYETACFTVRWKHESMKAQALEVLKKYPEAYVAVIADHNNVSVTIPKSQQASFIGDLSMYGLLVRPIGIEGQFHSSAHERALNKVINFCQSNTWAGLFCAESLQVPLRSNFDAKVISEGSLYETAAATLLTKVSDWYSVVKAAAGKVSSNDATGVVVFGLSDCIPASVLHDCSLNIARMNSSKRSAIAEQSITLNEEAPSKDGEDTPDERIPQDAIAIIGMGCKYAGADSLEEFWHVISDGISMAQELPESRWSKTGLRRTEDGTPFWGNFIRDADAFDHRFFKKSSREAAAMDPQQRILLQTAYHALESSGYFTETSPPDNIGCYIGVATTDYHDNVSSHQPSAFHALGELRAFLCGRISYHFGWTGPSLTYDTACSSSLVAIDAACKAIQSGQCARALAGGVSVNTSPYMWENLRNANFLSPTGQTKPFDAKADGYCRGEGAGLVVLKKLSDALEDGDQILGVIAGSGVNQCLNKSYITVPYGPSQASLYKQVLAGARIREEAITFVEAHGTGTQAGDPIEFASIREVLCSRSRDHDLYLGSTKGNIGHCEAASGVASLIKTVLMLQKEKIPPLASHSSLNPKISALETSRMVIPTRTVPWKGFRAALVNNYGAAGSNSAAIVCQPPERRDPAQKLSAAKYPVFISAATETSLAAYCQALRDYTTNILPASPSENVLADVTYNLARKQNPSHDHTFITTADSLEDLNERLASAELSSKSQPKPVVLVFGGQTSNHVGLSKDIYQASALLRSHLDHCNTVMKIAGLEEIFPSIFDDRPVKDVVLLHCMFFAIQYACAKSWIDCGIKVDAVVGHSFGQLTALCISGSLNLRDAVKLVSGRATLMRQHWGAEPGCMVSVEADAETISKILSILSASESGLSAEVACYNGPTSHVLVGDSKSIARVEQILADEQATLGAIRHRKLNVTHGFHSKFTEPLLPGLVEVASKVNFSKPRIPLETCSKKISWAEISPARILEHIRTPVYFGEAVHRISERLGSCLWLEAGTGSSVTGMVRRALGTSSDVGHTYQAMQLSGSEAVSRLADCMVNIWKAGHNVRFWLFHSLQQGQYAPLNLPPYQFEINRHWLPWKESTQEFPQSSANPEPEKFKLIKLIRKHSDGAEFLVDPRSDQYQMFVKGHAVLDSPLCPADLYFEIVANAAIELISDSSDKTEHLPSVESLSISAPLGINPEQTIKVALTRDKDNRKSWTFIFISEGQENPAKATTHATGKVILSLYDDKAVASEAARYQKLVGSERADHLLADTSGEGMHGDLVYNVFSKVVNYSDLYQGIKQVSARDDTYAAQITMPPNDDAALADTLVDPAALDNFVQVAGIKVNCLEEDHPNQVSVCGSIDRIQPTKEFFHSRDRENKEWSVWGQSTPEGKKDSLSDIFVFDEKKKLALMFLGVKFTRIPITSLTKVLNHANTGEVTASPSKSSHPKIANQVSRRLKQRKLGPVIPRRPVSRQNSGNQSLNDVYSTLRSLLNKVADVPMDLIKDDSTLEDLGIDSLMNTEVLAEVRATFGVDVPLQDFQDLQQFGSLAEYIVGKTLSAQPSSAITPALSDTESMEDGTESAITSMSEEVEPSKDGLVPSLARLISEQLETNVAMLPETCLGDHGLDSLLSVELTNDIEKAYEVKLGVGSLTGETTFGELVEMVLKQTKGATETDDISRTMPPQESSRTRKFPTLVDVAKDAKRLPGDCMQTVIFKQAGPTLLHADIYLPEPSHLDGSKRPVALMIHGGGHTMLSRKDIRPRQTELLLQNGFLPVSIDYRLCPEINIVDGAMTDVCDALRWARKDLPDLDLGSPGLRIDGDKVVVVGWSTGGTLSMTLGFTAPRRGVKAPDAILAFYCPTDYEADCWKQPNYPERSEGAVPDDYDLLEGVQGSPITAYNVDPKKAAVGGWMSLDDPRSRIVLHMNWKGQALPILLGGLPSRSKNTSDAKRWLKLEQPSKEEIVSISPFSQIQRNNYHTPTYLIHGTADDLIPWEQMRQTYDGLVSKGIPAGLSIVDDAVHLFDLYRDRDGKRWEEVLKGYAFLFQQVRSALRSSGRADR